MSRNRRQKLAHGWAGRAFGTEALKLAQRGLRHAEEAIELAQACEVPPELLHKLIDHIYGQPPGAIYQEIGGSGMTLLVLAETAGISADKAESDELMRVLDKPLEHFSARNDRKNDLGFKVD